MGSLTSVSRSLLPRSVRLGCAHPRHSGAERPFPKTVVCHLTGSGLMRPLSTLPVWRRTGTADPERPFAGSARRPPRDATTACASAKIRIG